MSYHLPECFASLCECDDTHFKSIDCDFSCICPSLRACEQRARQDERAAALYAAREAVAALDYGYNAGVQAARDAAAEWWINTFGPEALTYGWGTKALAAIDALREEKG